MGQEVAFATGVLPDIYAFHRYTRNSTSLYHTQEPQFPRQARGYAPTFNLRLAIPPTRALRPVNPDNACSPRITAAAGTELAGASSEGTVNRSKTPGFVPSESGLHPQGLHPARGVAASDLRPLCNIPHCCLP